jgi:uncharacterized protein YlxP (DUF503 family)
VTRSLLQRLRNRFDIAAAEVGDNDSWQLAVIGLAAVSNQSQHARETIDAAIKFIEDTRPDCEIVDAIVEIQGVTG